VDDFSLIGYSYSYFYGDKETGVSTSGYVMSLGSGVLFSLSLSMMCIDVHYCFSSKNKFLTWKTLYKHLDFPPRCALMCNILSLSMMCIIVFQARISF